MNARAVRCKGGQARLVRRGMEARGSQGQCSSVAVGLQARVTA